ncbi:ABC transporter ATP-binding protein [Salinibacterium sp. ZJ454]|uniref:ABC transporter ATP-binding protein n=1 Tax=Salinibacterium sp. ZJ454 TaxID=2708339 RepID=UPI001421C732|nr:ABC transporter ATP-binding protein [Salinibacterium sp. ZJ454]
MTSTALETRNLFAGYGRLDVLTDISVRLDWDGAIGIVGANGAGKSTLLKVLSGALRQSAGEVLLDGDQIKSERTWTRVNHGVVLAPEGHTIIHPLTVEENLRIGAFRFWPRPHRRESAEVLERVFTLFPRLAERRNQTAGSMSGGEQQMLSIGRSLMAEPRILLMDEPSLGLAPAIVDQIADALLELRRNGLAIVVAEQNSDLAQRLCERLYVLRLGSVVLESTSGAVEEEALRDAYFG